MLKVGDKLYCKLGRKTSIGNEYIFIVGKHYHINKIDIKKYKNNIFTKVYIYGDNNTEYYYVLESGNNEYYQLYDYFADKKEERNMKLKKLGIC